MVVDINAPFRSEHSLDIYSQHLDKLLTADHHREKLPWPRLKAALSMGISINI